MAIHITPNRSLMIFRKELFSEDPSEKYFVSINFIFCNLSFSFDEMKLEMLNWSEMCHKWKFLSVY